MIRSIKNSARCRQAARSRLLLGGTTADLHNRALSTLRIGLHDGQRFVKVHAAEALLACSRPAEIHAVFRSELASEPGPGYRTGVWRVLARLATGNGNAGGDYVRRMLEVFFDEQAPDRSTAGESLGKLRYADEGERMLELARDPRGDQAGVRAMARWIVANTGRCGAEQDLAALLASSHASVRLDAAYALRRLTHLTPETRRQVSYCTARETAGSPVCVYLLGATYVHSPLLERRAVKPYLLVYAAGASEERSEVCHALAVRGNAGDIPLVEELARDTDLDVRCSAAGAILQILRRTTHIGHPSR